LPAIAPSPQKSIAVLPFLDLTEGMRQEEFADGMTEELIDKPARFRTFAYLDPRPRFISRANKYLFPISRERCGSVMY
jgi:transcriptional activator of cad operon